MMQRVCFLLKVRPERLAEYKERHKAVWPEMLAALRGMAGREVNERWQREMAPFFEALDGRRPDEGMLALEEVFHLE